MSDEFIADVDMGVFACILGAKRRKTKTAIPCRICYAYFSYAWNDSNLSSVFLDALGRLQVGQNEGGCRGGDGGRCE